MDIDIALLQKSSLFSGISERGIREALALTGYTIRHYTKGEALVMYGYAAHELGILLSGKLTATKLAADGTGFTVALIQAGGMFGDVLSCGTRGISPVNVNAMCAASAIFIPTDKLFAPTFPEGRRHLEILHNLTREIADKYQQLDSRLELLLEKTLRGKILHYFSTLARHAHSPAFTLPYNRTALAAYLGCERTALARELTRMQKEGIIICNKRDITFCVQ